ncbi:MAG: AmmeMemoRadiSam system radical SAM enzyme [Nitrososphaerota archaeon]
MQVETYKYEKLEDNKVQCLICPHKCIIFPDKLGICRTRKNIDGKLFSIAYGEITSIAMDPIEKKPLYHFWPGNYTLSISTFGCNFRCPWCQNWSISQVNFEEAYTRSMKPEEIILIAKREGSRIISYTYNEPLIWFEFVMDTAKLAKKEGMKNVLVTNGYTLIDTFKDLAPYIDAANVDIKGFTKDFYKKYCGGEMEYVLEATKYMKKSGIHVETTYLIVTTVNDSREEIKKMCEWHLNELGSDTPLHFSRFFPMYKFTGVEATPIKTLEMAAEIAKSYGIKYVYLGNILGSEFENTYCPKCGRAVIERVGYDIVSWSLDKDNKCTNCGEKILIIGEKG